MQLEDQKSGVAEFKTVARPRTVLQIEDNEANATVVRELIGLRSDLVFLTAITGLNGIKMAIAHLPNVILMDIHLPDINGYEVLAALRSNPLTCNIPVIALSSNAFKKQIQEGLEAGFFRYLTKPFKFADLMNMIDLALDTIVVSSPSS
jgi:CheY-like chemotaxis protein